MCPMCKDKPCNEEWCPYTKNKKREVVMNKVVVVKAAWCQPCKAYAPVINQATPEIIAKGYEVEIIDADEQMDRCRDELKVRGVPSTIIYKDGVIIKTLVGTQTIDNLLKELI